ncbi:MAG: NADH-quinone oxidoreductase subunit M [Bacteroidetes bacterium]|nr:MAG: NADH-quinone oxidoreductase subunit M [Bacteroidota bacterium]
MILTLLTFLPLAALLLMAFLPRQAAPAHRWIALIITLLQVIGAALFLVPAWLAARAAGADAFALQEQLPWILLDLGAWGTLRLDYFLAADGLSLALTLLTLLLMPIAVLSSWKVSHRPQAYFMLLMLLDTSLVGVFLAMDFFLFFIFYELLLLPMFFLIGLWGGEKREYAALKFFLYTLAGSVFMLLVMAGLLFSYAAPNSAGEAPELTLNILTLSQFNISEPQFAIEGSVFAPGSILLGMDARLLGFVVLFLAFAIKLPAIPLHTWLPDAHVEAPTAISVILAGIVLKVGGYGMARLCYGIFPDAAAQLHFWIAGAGLVSILYGSLVAMGQKDLKRLVAYSSVAHMGYVMLGLGSLTAAGISGAYFQMIAHGLVSALLFLLVGVLYDRVHDREISHFRGLWDLMPRYSVVVMLAFFASLGLPGLCMFVPELLVYTGVLQSDLPLWLPALAVLGILLGAAYYLRTYRQMFFGVFDEGHTSTWRGLLTDLRPREYLMILPLVALIVVLGLLPGLVLDFLGGDATALADHVKTAITIP